MFKGTVNFVSHNKDHGLTFPAIEFDPQETGVEKVEIEAQNGKEITSTVHLSCVPSENDGRDIATKVNTAALDRIVFRFGIVFEAARRTGDHFSPVNPPPGVAYGSAPGISLTAPVGRVTVGVNPDDLKTELEKPSPSERYGLFRSARLSSSPVEEFMHLYNLLLMIFNDDQKKVDKFIHEQSKRGVFQSQSPKTPGVMETIYTRLRNEFAHKRAGVELITTKSEMAGSLDGLIELTKQAIELNP